jgi:hypothetical protein
MKLIGLNFDRWSYRANGGRLRRIYKRIYLNGYKWTPFIIIRFKYLKTESCL